MLSQFKKAASLGWIPCLLMIECMRGQYAGASSSDTVHITAVVGDTLLVNCTQPESNGSSSVTWRKTYPDTQSFLDSSQTGILKLLVSDPAQQGVYQCSESAVTNDSNPVIVLRTAYIFIISASSELSVRTSTREMNVTTTQSTESGEPRYIGLAIGLGVCLLLLLLSGCAVFLLNLKNNRGDTLQKVNAFAAWAAKKKVDDKAFKRLPSNGNSSAAPRSPRLKMLPITMERMQSINTHAT